MTEPILVFDDDCGFCTWWAEFFDDRSDIRIVGFSDLTPDLRDHLPDDYRDCSHLVTEDGVYSCGASIEEAFARSGVVPPARPIVDGLRRVPGYETARELCYGRVAGNRVFWGRFVSTTPPVRRAADGNATGESEGAPNASPKGFPAARRTLGDTMDTRLTEERLERIERSIQRILREPIKEAVREAMAESRSEWERSRPPETRPETGRVTEVETDAEDEDESGGGLVRRVVPVVLALTAVAAAGYALKKRGVAVGDVGGGADVKTVAETDTADRTDDIERAESRPTDDVTDEGTDHRFDEDDIGERDWAGRRTLLFRSVAIVGWPITRPNAGLAAGVGTSRGVVRPPISCEDTISNSLVHTTIHTYIHNQSRSITGYGMPISIDEFESHDPNRDRTNAERVLEFLVRNREKAYRAREIATATGVKENSIHPVLNRLEDRGLVRHREPYWAIGDPETVRDARLFQSVAAFLDDELGSESRDEWVTAARERTEDE